MKTDYMNLQVLDREKVKKIITILRKTGDSRKLSYKHISECPFNIESTAAIESNNIDIIVYFDDSILLSLQEEAIIHELLHILVRNDGFPEAIVSNTFLSNNPKARRMTTGCQFTLTSIIQHPEILRREMEIFDIDENLIFARALPHISLGSLRNPSIPTDSLYIGFKKPLFSFSILVF